MKKITAQIPSSSQKDGIEILSIEFDPASEGWFLHHGDDEFWHMSVEEAKDQASADYNVTHGDWSSEEENNNAPTRDSNGTELKNGDTVTLIKDLPVKGAGVTIKRGTTVKNITLTDNPEEIDCRTREVKGLVLKTCFVKKI